MNILLISASSRNIEFSFSAGGIFLIKEKLPSGNNADMLTYFIKKSFEDQKISMKEIEYVSISNGPGSFTGLRISSAIAKGICFTAGSRLLEINTLDIIANKHKSSTGIISLIFSNMKASEFYNCEYEFISGKLLKKSEYKTGTAGNIFKDGINFVINEIPDEIISKQFGGRLKDVSGISDSDSHLELTKDHIDKNLFIDYRTSEPFYMKEFIPKI